MRTRVPKVKRAEPKPLYLSLSISTSDTKPQATERKEKSLRVAEWLLGGGLVVTETKSMGRTPPRHSKKQQFKRRGSLRHISYPAWWLTEPASAFPEPQGRMPTGVFIACSQSGRSISPLITSWSRPSPETMTMPSHSGREISLMSSLAWFWRSVWIRL